ncbi:translation elongation factor 4 [Patescibacteria group bacterium]|nr:translation elongation factor 4 [Patescibacteria group bacterium]
MTNSDLSLIRNFSIIAHIDHGKTTLTDAFLRLTGAVSDLNFHARMMDSNPIEQEKGVTIKLAPVRMNYEHLGKKYILNLIDTPGHVDFGYEVDRSLAACEGALLLIDATQGVQAQTLANYQKAKNLKLKIIPVINKIDLPSANVEQSILEIMEFFELNEEEVLMVSAKTGQGVEKVLQRIIEEVPAPGKKLIQEDHVQESDKLRALIITSKFDNHQGAIAYMRVVNGEMSKKDMYLSFSKTKFLPVEIGIFAPEKEKRAVLKEGEVGYIATGLKDISLLKVGDTITSFEDREMIEVLPGYKEPTPMVFMEIYPVDSKDFSNLKDAMAKLTMHDSALQYQSTHSIALGNGLRVGFLGIFHAEIVRERLMREFDLDLIATAPSVTYQILTTNDKTIEIHSPAEMPDLSRVRKILEPIAKLSVFCPEDYVSAVMKLCHEKRATLENSIGTGNRNRLEYLIPLAELITDFHDKLKSATSGFASMEYVLQDFREVDAVKVEILVNKESIEALSFITVADNVEAKARAIVKKLKEVIPRQLFEIPIQASIGAKVIARETIKAWRKDVTAKLYGGDRTRRMKLLAKQAKGKKRMKQIGQVQLNQDAFLAVLET